MLPALFPSSSPTYEHACYPDATYIVATKIVKWYDRGNSFQRLVYLWDLCQLSFW